MNPVRGSDGTPTRAESGEYLTLARTWAHGLQSGRRISLGDRMQMYSLVHNQLPLISNHPRWNELWRAFEDCVNLGIARLLASPSTIRELHRPDAMARFHTYALALARGFARLQMDYNQAAEVAPVLQRLDYWHDRPRSMREVIKLVLQDRLGLPPPLLASEIPGCDNDAGTRRFRHRGGRLQEDRVPSPAAPAHSRSRAHGLAAPIALCVRATPIQEKDRVFAVLEASG